MGIYDNEEELFGLWRADIPGFVMDGAVDPEAYLSSRPKILFLLKEVNDQDGGGWCLREFLRNAGRPQTWSNVARWIQGIRNSPAEMPWNSIRDITDEQRRCLLRTVAAVNLKKTPGGHTADTSDLWNVVRRDAEYLRQQFSFYSADLVICCGVAEVFKTHIEPASRPKWISTTRGFEFLEYSQGKFVVDYVHPAARVRENLLYYGLIDALREILSAP